MTEIIAEDVVIVSGPTGWAACRGVWSRGGRPLVIDVGYTANSDKGESVVRNPTVKSKTLFGSEHMYTFPLNELQLLPNIPSTIMMRILHPPGPQASPSRDVDRTCKQNIQIRTLSTAVELKSIFNYFTKKLFFDQTRAGGDKKTVADVESDWPVRAVLLLVDCA